MIRIKRFRCSITTHADTDAIDPAVVADTWKDIQDDG